ncbi:MAG: hypothetical protein KAH44_22485, partial [Oricola sp.]|nr:hypothetical protein [Oricola sp.]
LDGDEDAVVVQHEPYAWTRVRAGLSSGMSVLIQNEAAAWAYAGALANRPEFTDSLAYADFESMKADEKQSAVLEGLRDAAVVANPKKDLASLGQRMQLTINEEYLSPEKTRARLRMEEGGEPPAALLRNMRAPAGWSECAPADAGKSSLALCYGIYRDLRVGDPLEFMLIRINGPYVQVEVFEDISDGWASYGASSENFDETADDLFNETNLRWSDWTVRTEFATKFLEDLAVVDPLYGDIVMGDIQYMVRYEQQ